jgi:predicted NUDIX family NTP pyrophosphohydrolase
MVKDFKGFTTDSKEPTDAAGVAIVLDSDEGRMILLVHPTNSSWQRPTMGIPKGRIESGESPFDAALRETFEETGITLDRSKLEPGIQTAEVWKGTKFLHNIHYLICRISSPSEIGLSGLKVPPHQLQQHEVDWAGFVKIDEAYERMAASQRIILDRLS